VHVNPIVTHTPEPPSEGEAPPLILMKEVNVCLGGLNSLTHFSG